MLWLALACSSVEYRDADLVLDVARAVPDDADAVVVCIEDVGAMSFGARIDGRFAVTGLPAGDAVDVTVDVLVEDAVLERAAVTGLDGYGTAQVEACEECVPCDEDDAFATAGEDTWVLAVRFSD
ncbi:MAG: hypothetical protein GY913_21325 [Proteobacteria bacterium]|nr:hypothetical protein [Pseudomonadota bacterium]MCP4919450.1 hypothetical protein [Pseudomonadota bacterium]